MINRINKKRIKKLISYNLGCGKEIDINTNNGFICGVANAWGEERLCKECKLKLRKKWEKEDRDYKQIPKQLKGGNN